jgi:hypothetical protein
MNSPKSLHVIVTWFYPFHVTRYTLFRLKVKIRLQIGAPIRVGHGDAVN